MANIPPIQFKRSHSSGSIPTPDQLAVGELAINMADNKLYTKDSDGIIRNVGGSSGTAAALTVVDSEAVLDEMAISDPTIKNKSFGAVIREPVRRLVVWDSDENDFIQVGALGVDSEWQLTVQSVADLKKPSSMRSPGYVYVEDENELFYWSSYHDQTKDNGWQPFFPTIARTGAQIIALDSEAWVQVDNKDAQISTESLGYFSAAEKLAAPGTMTARAPTTATITLQGNATNTHVTRTPDSDNEIRLVPGTTNQNGTVHYAFSNTNFKYHKGFEATWSQYIGGGNSADAMWVCIGGSDNWATNQTDSRNSWYNSAMNGYLIYMDVYDNNNFVRHARLYGPGGEQLVARSNTISDLRANSWVTCKLSYCPFSNTLKFYHNGTLYIEYNFETNGKVFSTELSARLSAGAYTGGLYDNFFFGRYGVSVKHYSERITTGSYYKAKNPNLTSGFELRPGTPIRVATGTRTLKSYSSVQNMLAMQTTDGHVDGGVYKVETQAGDIRYYEYNKAVAQGTGTLADYNEISRKDYTYSTEGAMFADQANQRAGQWYFIDGNGYLYNGGTTASLNDYSMLEKSFDPVNAVKRESMVFQPEHLRTDYIFHNVRNAVTSGFLRDWQDGVNNFSYIDNWTGGRTIMRSTGSRDSGYQDIKIKIPAGTGSCTILILNDRSWAGYIGYDDGNQEFIGKFGFNNNNRTYYPNVTGRGPGFGNRTDHLIAFTFPTSIANKDRWIRFQSAQDIWFGGIYYGKKNDWCYSNQYGYGFDTGTDLVGGTAPARNRISSVTTISNPQSLPIPAWNSGANWNGEQIFAMSTGGTYEIYPVATSKTDCVLYFQTRGDDTDTFTEWSAFTSVTINDSDVVSESHGGADKIGAGFSPQFVNPIANSFNYGVYNGYMGLYVPASYIKMRYDSDGNEVPTPQKVRLTRHFEGSSTYYRTVGFHKLGFAEASVTINEPSNTTLAARVTGHDSDISYIKGILPVSTNITVPTYTADPFSGALSARTPVAQNIAIYTPNDTWQTQATVTGLGNGSLASIFFSDTRTPDNISGVSQATDLVYATTGVSNASVAVGGTALSTTATGSFTFGTSANQTIGGLTYSPNIMTGGASSNDSKLCFPRTAGVNYEYEWWGRLAVDNGAYQVLCGTTSVTTVTDDWSVAGNIGFRRNGSNTSIHMYNNPTSTSATCRDISLWNFYRVGIYLVSGNTYSVRLWQNNQHILSGTITIANLLFAIGSIRNSADSRGTFLIENARVRTGGTDPGANNWVGNDEVFGSTGTALNTPLRTNYWHSTDVYNRGETYVKSGNIWLKT